MHIIKTSLILIIMAVLSARTSQPCQTMVPPRICGTRKFCLKMLLELEKAVNLKSYQVNMSHLPGISRINGTLICSKFFGIPE